MLPYPLHPVRRTTNIRNLKRTKRFSQSSNWVPTLTTSLLNFSVIIAWPSSQTTCARRIIKGSKNDSLDRNHDLRSSLRRVLIRHKRASPHQEWNLFLHHSCICKSYASLFNARENLSFCLYDFNEDSERHRNFKFKEIYERVQVERAQTENWWQCVIQETVHWNVLSPDSL